MGDESYLSYLFGDSKFSLKTSEFIKRLEEIEQEEREYKVVFTDLEDLERSIREAGYRPMEVRPLRSFTTRVEPAYDELTVRTYNEAVYDLAAVMTRVEPVTVAANPHRTVRRRGYQSRYRTMEDFYGFDF